MRYVIFLFFYFLSLNGFCQNKYVLEGTVGKYPVVMMIEETKDADSINLDAKYFYKSNLHDIALEGKVSSRKEYILKKESYDSVEESFVITRISDSKWSGIWRNSKSKLPVILSPIDTTKYLFNTVPELGFENKEERIYAKARLSAIHLKKDSLTRYRQYELQWYTEPFTKISLFRIKTGYNPGMLGKINAILEKNQYTHIENAFGCISRQYGIEYYYNIGSYYITNRLLSINAFNYYDCGGMHPDGSHYNITIYCTTGLQITNLDDIFWFTGKKPIAASASNYDEYLENRARAIIRILTRLYPKEMTKTADDDNPCDYSQVDHWSNPDWYFTARGLYISATFPHVAMACSSPEFSIIPYKNLLPYIVKDKKYLLPINN